MPKRFQTAALLQPPSRKGVAGPRYDHATLAGLETVREIPPYGWHMVQLLPGGFDEVIATLVRNEFIGNERRAVSTSTE
jgi:hypothetical protein